MKSSIVPYFEIHENDGMFHLALVKAGGALREWLTQHQSLIDAQETAERVCKGLEVRKVSK